MENSTYLSQKLKELRLTYGLTQNDVAEIIDKERSSIAKYENGAAVPPIIILNKFAKIYNISVDELVGNSKLNKNLVFHAKASSKSKKDSENFLDVPIEYRKLLLRMRLLDKEEFNRIQGEVYDMTEEKAANGKKD